MIPSHHLPIGDFITALDLGGTFVFALSGGATGVKRRLDIFGILVLAFIVGNAGGMTRDVLIGAVPPAAIKSWSYLAVSAVAGLVAFLWMPRLGRHWNSILVFDAIGLALFAVVGTQKALAYGLNPLMAALMGMVTGVGGGMVRDVLVTEVPVVLRADLYAVAALAAAAVVAFAHLLRLPSTPAVIVGALLCFGLRMGAMHRGWHLPIARAAGME